MNTIGAQPPPGNGVVEVTVKTSYPWPLGPLLWNPANDSHIVMKSTNGVWKASDVPTGHYFIELVPAELAWTPQCYAYDAIVVRRGLNRFNEVVKEGGFFLEVDTTLLPKAARSWILLFSGCPTSENPYIINAFLEPGISSLRVGAPFLKPGTFLARAIDTGNRGRVIEEIRLRISAAQIRNGLVHLRLTPRRGAEEGSGE